MSILIDKVGFIAQIHGVILSRTFSDGDNVDGMKLLRVLSGMLMETLLLFDDPDEGLAASLAALRADLGCTGNTALAEEHATAAAVLIDGDGEHGRELARGLFEEWLECTHAFHELLLFYIQHIIVAMDAEGHNKEDVFSLFSLYATRCLAYEIAAQELCDLIIETKICQDGWSMGESISGLSAIAGRCLALSQNACSLFVAPALPDRLDQVAYVMTQEAIRLGIPAGTDWRFGLAANDCPASAPFDLVFSLWPECREFFRVIINLSGLEDQAVACAKAAGRMLAIAAGGEKPELEPVIAKPLAMAAMTETYRVVCRAESAESMAL